MTIYAPPAKTAISDTYPNPSNAVARAGFGALWDYCTSLLGLTGNPADARTALGLGNAASTNSIQTFTASQRGAVTTDNDLSFDMSVTNNFKCTLAGTATLTFTNITAGQSGYVLLVNTSGFAVTAAATTKVNTTFLTTVSTAGTYLVSYFSPDSSTVYVTTGGAMA